jgi:hypothetical protein
MAGDDTARMCARCSRHVYDFSTMTQAEAEALVRQLDGKLCVRLSYVGATRTVRTADSPVPGAAATRRSLRLASATLAGLLGLSGSVNAQEVARDHQRGWVVTGTLTDQSHEALRWVWVRMRDSAGREVGFADTGGTGEFHIAGLSPGTYTIELEHSSIVATRRVLTISPSASGGTVRLDIVLRDAEVQATYPVVGVFAEPNLFVRILYVLTAPLRGMKHLVSRSRS